MQASVLSNRYVLDDFPNNEELREIVEEIKRMCMRLFNAKHANVTPLSGMNCMELILSSVCEPGDNIYTINPRDGGHGSTQKICSLFGLQLHHLPYDPMQNMIDIEKLGAAFASNNPKAVYLDNTLILFHSDIAGIKAAAQQHGAPVIYDASHVLGLIAGKAFPNPLEEGTDMLNGSTHKTFFGSQKGIILTNDSHMAETVDHESVDFVSSSHTGSLLALYVACAEMEKYGSQYAAQVVKNAQELGRCLHQQDVKVQCAERGFTETHQLWIDARPVDAQEAYLKLARCNINVNAIRIPSIRTNGLRLGTAEITRLGMEKKDMRRIAELIADTLFDRRSASRVRDDVIQFSAQYQQILFSFDSDPPPHVSGKDATSVIEDQRFNMHAVEREMTQDEYVVFAKEYCDEKLSVIHGFKGMLLRGGVGRKTADKFSDIDFTVVFDGNVLKIISDNQLPKGMHLYKGIMFSGRYLSLDDFADGAWSQKMKHAYSYVVPVQCDERILHIIRERTRITPEEQRKNIVGNIIELGEICKVFDDYKGFSMFSEIYKQYRRGELLTAHMEIDRAIIHLKQIIFDLNFINYPESKNYYIRNFSNLPVQPENFDEQATRILEMPNDLRHFAIRLSLLMELSRNVIAFCEKHVELPQDIYSYYMS